MYRRFFIAGNAVDENEQLAEANSITLKKVKLFMKENRILL